MERAKETLSKKGQSRRNFLRLAAGGVLGALAALTWGREVPESAKEQIKEKAEKEEEKKKAEAAALPAKPSLPKPAEKQKEVNPEKELREALAEGLGNQQFELIFESPPQPFYVLKETEIGVNIRKLPVVSQDNKIGALSPFPQKNRKDRTPDVLATVVTKETGVEYYWLVFKYPLIDPEIKTSCWGPLAFACQGKKEPGKVKENYMMPVSNLPGEVV